MNFTLYYGDYVRLYSHTIAVAVAQEDPNRPFIMSSPSNGKESDMEGFVAKEPWSELYGDSMYAMQYLWVMIMSDFDFSYLRLSSLKFSRGEIMLSHSTSVFLTLPTLSFAVKSIMTSFRLLYNKSTS